MSVPTTSTTPVVVNQPLQGGAQPVYTIPQPQPLDASTAKWVGDLCRMTITAAVGKQLMKRNPYLPGILMSIQRGVTTMGQAQTGIDVDMQNAQMIHQMQAQALQPQVIPQQVAPQVVNTDVADLKQMMAEQAARHDELLDRLQNVKGFK